MIGIDATVCAYLPTIFESQSRVSKQTEAMAGGVHCDELVGGPHSGAVAT